ncbi:MoxR family ATPase [Clostridium sp. AWRP]|uniref:AAA family ATPase n=1 Tax=Clostridium sp. AWRP TaxID=2212991 RepID=UPI000FD90E78|nr:MoxR family ATPase [Clostridium sp. AWRP]AZV57189.1 MoxR family ATPase [Clostridium sp. AWRP]
MENANKLFTENNPESCRNTINRVIDNVSKVIIGKRQAIEIIVLALVSGGHVLIEDIPGVGKTSMISALSRSVSCKFKRIQFTPDVMPSDVTGFSIYNQKTGKFEFRPGAAMSNFVLADEINRASPKTQSSLLEVMEEKQITVDGHTYVLDEPFMVFATENPVEYLGTYPLPEAQIDRFLVRTSLGYPSLEEEMRVVSQGSKAKKTLKSVASGEDILKVRDEAEKVHVDDLVLHYIIELSEATRNHPEILIGSSPRGSIALYKMSKAYAFYMGRDFVLPDDVKRMAPYVLPHRLVLNHAAKTKKRTDSQIFQEIMEKVAVPIIKNDEK